MGYRPNWAAVLGHMLAHADEIHVIPYNRACDVLRWDVAMLQHRAAPGFSSRPAKPVPPEHDPTLDPLAFYLLAESRVVSYAAVLHKQVACDGETLGIAGLSCVATDPVYQRHGLGSRVVASATRYLEHSTIDMGIFTCDPGLRPFYERAGGWLAMPGVVLVGGSDEGGPSSVTLQKVVLMRLFSAKARDAADRLSRATINLDLPPGQFW